MNIRKSSKQELISQLVQAEKREQNQNEPAQAQDAIFEDEE